MSFSHKLLTGLVTAGLVLGSTLVALPSWAADKVTLRMSCPCTETDLRSQGLQNVFAAKVSSFADYQPHYNATLFKQGTELTAIARGNLEMSITSAQELAKLIPDWSVFTAGYLLRDADHQRKVFTSDIGEEFFQMAEDKLGVKLLGVMYFGKRHLNLRTDKKVMTPDDMAGVKLRMPGTDAWQFLGKALGANPTPMAFTEVYTGLQTGAIDGQDNPLPTDKDKKFYEVTKQIILTGHLADMNFLALSKKVWDGMTAAQQDQLQKAANDAMMVISINVESQEALLEDFFRKEGLQVYTPNVDAFRKRAQEMYLASDFSKEWPKGVVERVNATR